MKILFSFFLFITNCIFFHTLPFSNLCANEILNKYELWKREGEKTGEEDPEENEDKKKDEEEEVEERKKKPEKKKTINKQIQSAEEKQGDREEEEEGEKQRRYGETKTKRKAERGASL